MSAPVTTPTGWPLIGHPSAVRLLQRSLTTERLAHAYLFTGPPNIGKTTLALLFAQALLCEDEAAGAAGLVCGVCSACRRALARTHPDLRLIEPAGAGDDDLSGDSESGASRRSQRKAASRAQIKIETVREVQRELALRPYQGRRRVVVLTQADALNDAAENALLKTLEEPPAHALLLLTAEETEYLLPTTVSRCQQVPLQPVPHAVIAEALVGKGMASADADRLARLSGGRVGWALNAARDPGLLARRAAGLDGLTRVLAASPADRLALAEELSKKPDTLPDMLSMWQGWWRDALLLQAGCGEWVVNVDSEPTLRRLVRREPAALTDALRAVRRAAEELERNANPRLTLEVLLLSLPTPL